MTASALLTVVGVALLMQLAGLSAALGAFIAGALLADSEYRHQIEADIAPFETLLLGLFFTAIGMSLNLPLLFAKWPLVLAIVAALVAAKAIVLFAVGRLQSLDVAASPAGDLHVPGGRVRIRSPGTRSSGRNHRQGAVRPPHRGGDAVDGCYAVAAGARRHVVQARNPPAAKEFDVLPEAQAHVVIAGFGPVGQVVARILRAHRIPFTALDISPDQIAMVRRYGAEGYFGDAARLDILQAAKTANATAFVLAIDDVEASLKVAAIIRAHFPELPIYARARNRQHVYRLMDLGIQSIRRETFMSSVELTRELLTGLGHSSERTQKTIDRFVAHDRQMLYDGYKYASDTDKLQTRARDAARELEALLAQDEADIEADASVKSPKT